MVYQARTTAAFSIHNSKQPAADFLSRGTRNDFHHVATGGVRAFETAAAVGSTNSMSNSALFILPRPQELIRKLSPPTSVTAQCATLVTVLLFGIIAGRFSKSLAFRRRFFRRRRRVRGSITNADNIDETVAPDAVGLRQAAEQVIDDQLPTRFPESTGGIKYTEGNAPTWINFAIKRMWTLFQKNTKRLVSETFQPIIDESEKPDFVTKVTLTKFIPGRQSPRLQYVQRLPSRALAEVQYATQMLFSSTSISEFDVEINLGNKIRFHVPVTLKNLDVNAMIWFGSTLAPYEPFVVEARTALLEPPKISFDMTVAKLLPITAIPVLNSFFFRIITQEIPKEFILPKTILLDLTPPKIAEVRDTIMSATSITTTSPSDIIIASSEADLKREFPEQWALFDAMDLDGNGELSSSEIFCGLMDWGYTAQDSMEVFEEFDTNRDGHVDFREFCELWPTLADSFVPNRYAGELIVFVREATGVRHFDPFVEIKLNDQQDQSRRDSETTAVGGDLGHPIWMQAFDFKCMDVEDEVLEVSVVDQSILFGRRTEIATVTVPLSDLANTRNKKLRLNLEPEGVLYLDLSYANFV